MVDNFEFLEGVNLTSFDLLIVYGMNYFCAVLRCDSVCTYYGGQF